VQQKKWWRLLRGSRTNNSNVRYVNFWTATFAFLNANIYICDGSRRRKASGIHALYCAFQPAMQTRPTWTSSRLHTSDVARQLTSCIFSSCLKRGLSPCILSRTDLHEIFVEAASKKKLLALIRLKQSHFWCNFKHIVLHSYCISWYTIKGLSNLG